jgi:hypothetical protein
MGRKPIQSTKAVWRDRLVRFRKCSLTVKEFCRQEGVSDPSFYRWRQLLDGGRQGAKRTGRSGGRRPKTAESPPFMPVKVLASGDTQSALFTSAFAEVELPSGVRIRVPAAHTGALRMAILTGNEVCREVG